MNKFKIGDRVKWEFDGQVKYGIFDGYYGADDMYAYVIFKAEKFKTCWVLNLSLAEEPERKFKKGDRVKWEEYKREIQYGIFDEYFGADDVFAYVTSKNEGINKTCYVSDLSPVKEPERKFKRGDIVKWEYKGKIQYGVFDGYYEGNDIYAKIIFEDGKVEICCVSNLSPVKEPERKFKRGDIVKWEFDGQVRYGIFHQYYRADDLCAYVFSKKEGIKTRCVLDLSLVEEPERKFKQGDRVKGEYKREIKYGILDGQVKYGIFEDGKFKIGCTLDFSPAEEPANDSADETVGDKEDPTELPESFADKLMRDNIAATIYGRRFPSMYKTHLEYSARKSFDAADIFMKIRREKQK